MINSYDNRLEFHWWKNRDDHQQLLNQSWDLEHIIHDIDYEEKRLREEIEDRTKIIMDLKLLANKVDKTKFVKTVYLQKSRNYANNLIQYFAGVYNEPVIEGGKNKRTVLDAKLFEGGYTLKSALEYAANLAKKYKCKIILENFNDQQAQIEKRLNNLIDQVIIDL